MRSSGRQGCKIGSVSKLRSRISTGISSSPSPFRWLCSNRAVLSTDVLDCDCPSRCKRHFPFFKGVRTVGKLLLGLPCRFKNRTSIKQRTKPAIARHGRVRFQSQLSVPSRLGLGKCVSRSFLPRAVGLSPKEGTTSDRHPGATVGNEHLQPWNGRCGT
ncbi:hypothetical protein BJX62DRAFT_13943 [Aspergillus germanicus]